MLEEQSFRIVLAEQALDDRLRPPAPQLRHVTLIYGDFNLCRRSTARPPFYRPVGCRRRLRPCQFKPPGTPQRLSLGFLYAGCGPTVVTEKGFVENRRPL